MLHSMKVCSHCPHLTDLADSAHHSDSTTSFQSARPPLSRVPDLLSSTIGKIPYDESLCLRNWLWTHLEEHVSETSLTSSAAEPALMNPQMPISDWKVTAKEGLEVASQFTQMLLKQVPDCVDTNPVKVAFAIAKVIIDIKDVSCHLCISSIGWLLL